MVEGALEAYSLALADLDAAQMRDGVLQAIRGGGEHPPSAGALRKLCLGESRQTIEARAHGAFIKIDAAARRVGAGFNVRELGDPLAVHAVGALGGWRRFCESIPSEWDRRNFIESYVAAAENPELAEHARLTYGGEPQDALADLRQEVLRAITADPGAPVVAAEAEADAPYSAVEYFERLTSGARSAS